MKRHYIIPSTEVVAFQTAYLCGSSVGSAKGSGLHYGGSGGTGGSLIDPM